jgi:nucleotide-binding universal stress UspA family protein
MLLVHTILHPTDFSERSAAAFQLACALAMDYEAQLVVVHVTPELAVTREIVTLPPEPADVWNTLQEELANLRAPTLNVRLETYLREGDPTTEILRLADEIQSDLIVMGMQGRTGLERVLMGSVAEAVVRKARYPVLTVKTSRSEVAAPKGRQQKVAAV